MANQGLAGFESVNEYGATWEPKKTGTKKEKNLVELQPTDASYIIGWYTGTKEVEGKDGQSAKSVHSLKMKEVGDKAHIVGDLAPDGKINVWGTGVLNKLIAENVQIGQCIAIVWKGKVEPKQGSNPYHTWDVMVNNKIEPLNLAGTIPSFAESTPQAKEMTEATPVAAQSFDEDEDDDGLPF